jgi:predicted RNase H-like nuclease (RuvC/YqgF family)
MPPAALADPATYFIGVGTLLTALVGLVAFIAGQRRQWRTIGAEQKNADTEAWETLTIQHTKEIARLEGRVTDLDRLWEQCEANKRELIEKYGAVQAEARRDRSDLRDLEREHAALKRAHDRLGKKLDNQTRGAKPRTSRKKS